MKKETFCVVDIESKSRAPIDRGPAIYFDDPDAGQFVAHNCFFEWSAFKRFAPKTFLADIDRRLCTQAMSRKKGASPQFTTRTKKRLRWRRGIRNIFTLILNGGKV